MPIPEISYVLVTSWYGFTCGNLIPPDISWATTQNGLWPLVAPVFRRCVRVVWCRGDRGPDLLEAQVGVGGGARTRVLAPGHRDLSARSGLLPVDERERQDRAGGVQGGRLVGQADEARRAGKLNAVPGVGEVVAVIRAERRVDVLRLQDQRDLGARRGLLGPAQRVAADEVVVERDRAAVAQLPGRDVVVLNVVGVVAPVERALALDAEQRQPGPVVRQARVG